VSMGSAQDVVYLLSLPAGKPTTVDGGGGRDTVWAGAGDTRGILSPVSVINSSGSNVLFVDDFYSDVRRQVVHYTYAEENGASWSLVLGMTGADIRYKNADTETAILSTGVFGAAINVLRTAGDLRIFGNDPVSGSNQVFVGFGVGLQDIRGSVT